MTNMFDGVFAFLIFPGGLFPVILGLGFSLVLIMAGFGLWDIASRFAGGTISKPFETLKRFGGQHD